MAVITGFYAALSALLVVVLIGMVSNFRRSHAIGFGGYDNRDVVADRCAGVGEYRDVFWALI